MPDDYEAAPGVSQSRAQDPRSERSGERPHPVNPGPQSRPNFRPAHHSGTYPPPYPPAGNGAPVSRDPRGHGSDPAFRQGVLPPAQQQRPPAPPGRPRTASSPGLAPVDRDQRRSVSPLQANNGWPPPNGRPPQPGGGSRSAALPLPPGPRNSQPQNSQQLQRPAPQFSGRHPVPPVVPAVPAAVSAPFSAPPEPPVRSAEEELILTDQMEPIGEATIYRRKIDNSLARFSAAHDDAQRDEAERKQRRDRLTAGPVKLLEQTMTRLSRVVHPEAPSEPVDGAKLEPTGDEAVSSEKPAQTRLQEKKSRRSRRSELAIRITAGVLAGLVFLATGTAWGAKTWYDSGLNKVEALDKNSADIRNAAAQAGDQNFLIIGSDSRDGAEAEENVGNSDEVPGARADTMMLAHIPADRSRVIVVSFPRDLEVSRPACPRWDSATSKYTKETVPAQRIAKLNSVYTLGGPGCVTKWIQQLTGMEINHFMGIDFNGFKAMVDAAGGVNVHLDNPIDDSVLGKIFPEAGDFTISGDQALNFVRARHVKGDPTSDYGRIKRQQQFISSLLKKAMSKEVLFNPTKLTSFVTAFANATFGDNIGVDQLLTLGQSMQGLDTGKITFLTVPTVGLANSRGNEVLMKEQAEAIFQALIENGPLPSEKAAASSENSTATPTTSATATATKSAKPRS